MEYLKYGFLIFLGMPPVLVIIVWVSCLWIEIFSTVSKCFSDIAWYFKCKKIDKIEAASKEDFIKLFQEIK